MLNKQKTTQDTQWKRMLTVGNECYSKQNFLQAEYYYKEAESELLYLWSVEPLDIHLLMAWICTLHNLSTLFEQQGDKELGFKYLLIPHQRMLELSKSNEISQELKLIAIKALNITFQPVLAFAKNNPICKGCEKSLNSLVPYFDNKDVTLH